MTRNRPPPNRIRSRPEISLPNTVNNVWRRVATQVMENSSAIRVTMAKPQTEESRACPLRTGQAVDQDGQKDDVVDAENDLEHRERQK